MLHQKYQLRFIILFAHIIFLYNFLPFNISSFFIGIVIYFYFVLTLGIVFHRYFAHKSFCTHRYLEIIFGFSSILLCQSSPISWAANHRTHHQFSDKIGDPHSPIVGSALKVYLGVYPLLKISPYIVKDLLKDPFLRFLHNNYYRILLVFVSMILYFGGIHALAYYYCLPLILVTHFTSCINVFAHQFGYRNHNTDDNSRNNILISIFTLGECWHNNHHAFPSHYRHGQKKWEFDFHAFIIEKILKKDR
jgi:fatty-acid desaturase